MGANSLSKRENWQAGARVTADAGEKTFASMIAEFLPNHYTIDVRPKLIVYPDDKGIVLDLSVTNSKTGKSLYIEKKTGNNGGNAHERAYRYISDGLIKRVKGSYNTVENPFFLVFSGDTFQHPKYINELDLILEGKQYAIMKPNFANIQEVVQQIIEIVK